MIKTLLFVTILTIIASLVSKAVVAEAFGTGDVEEEDCAFL